MDAAQDLFDDLPNVSMGQGLFQAQGLHSKLIAFRESLDHRYDAFSLSNAHPDTAAHETTTKDTFLQLTIYGLYLQLKILVLLPWLQVATWRALGHASMLKSSEVVDGMARQCVDAALSTVSCARKRVISQRDDHAYFSYHFGRSGCSNDISHHSLKLPRSEHVSAVVYRIEADLSCPAIPVVHFFALCYICDLHGCPKDEARRGGEPVDANGTVSAANTGAILSSSRHASRSDV
jgi:hypothetical protein